MPFFTLGQTVHSRTHGRGVVIEINNKHCYPIKVQFESGIFETYTLDGQIVTDQPFDLFQTEPIFKPNTPITTFKKGDLVWVASDGGEWRVRYYSHFDGIDHQCFYNQRKDGCTSAWTHIRKFEDCPL